MGIFEQRLSSIMSPKVSLNAQMYELNCLRGRIEKAELTAKNAQRPNLLRYAKCQDVAKAQARKF